MKKILLSLFAISGLFLLTGCSLIETTVDNNSEILEQVSLLQQQIIGLNSEIQELKEQNNKLIEENETIKISLSDQNNTIVDDIQINKEIGLIKQIYVDQNENKKLEIDYIQLGGQNECGGGVACIINENPKLRTYKISNDVEIFMQTLTHTSDGSFNRNQNISFDYFLQKFTDVNQYDEYPHNYSRHLKVVPYWITIENNTITKIEEQYIS